MPPAMENAFSTPRDRRIVLLGICFLRKALKEPLGGPEEGEKGMEEVLRCISGRYLEKKKSKTTLV